MITSERKHFVGFHVTWDVRERLRVEASRRSMSVSGLVYLIVREALGIRTNEVTELESRPRT